jgi:hypothetical protein
VTGAPPAETPGPTRTKPVQHPWRLPRHRRNLLLTVHIVVAVGALATDAILSPWASPAWQAATRS